MARHDPDFGERLQTARKAKQAQLAKARANAPSNLPGYAEKQAERVTIVAAREKRKSEAAARKLAEVARLAEEQAAAALAAQLALNAQKAALEADAARKAGEAIALKAEQKARRDAKYAARQARRDARR